MNKKHFLLFFISFFLISSNLNCMHSAKWQPPKTHKRKCKTNIFTLIERNNQTALEDLLKKKPNAILSTNTLGQNPLHVAAAKGNPYIVQILINGCTNVNAQDHVGNTPLHYAVESNKLFTVIKLIKANANLDAQNKLGFTPLHIATTNENLEIVIVLLGINRFVSINMGLKIQAKLDIQNNFGNTPLHIAATTGNLKIVGLLVENGAKVLIKNNANMTPLELVKHIIGKQRDSAIKTEITTPPMHTKIHALSLIRDLLQEQEAHIANRARNRFGILPIDVDA